MPVRQTGTVRAQGGLAQRERELREARFWVESPAERPGTSSLEVLTQKLSEAAVVVEKLQRYGPLFRRAGTVLELGGGQGWVSCMVKHRLGDGATVIGSDIAPAAVASRPEWERVFGVGLDGALACRSYEVPVRSASIDLVVVFAAAHHFGAHRRTLEELARVLAPGGRALYLHEPGCRPYLYRLARRRVNAKRPAVPEDVLRYGHLVELAGRAGLAVEVHFAPTTTARGVVETLYYWVLQRAPWLQRVLPCTVDLVFTRPR